MGYHSDTFLGLLIDTHHQRILIPSHKVAQALLMIRNLISRKRTTLRHMQKLCGFLNFLCKAIVPGRPFVRHFYNATKGLTQPHHHLYLTKQIKDDLRMWESFCQHPAIFARPFFQMDSNVASLDLDLFTDASTTLGCGGYFVDQWFIG